MDLKDAKFRNCLYYTSNALSRVLSRMAEEEFKSVGLAPSYAFLLMTVNAKPGIQPGDISQELQLKPSTVSRLVEKMENQGYVERISKGRATEVYPLQKSADLEEVLQDSWKSLNERYADILGERYSEVLTEMTHKAAQELE